MCRPKVPRLHEVASVASLSNDVLFCEDYAQNPFSYNYRLLQCKEHFKTSPRALHAHFYEVPNGSHRGCGELFFRLVRPDWRLS